MRRVFKGKNLGYGWICFPVVTTPDSGRAVEKRGILLQNEKAAKISNGDPRYHASSFEDALAHLANSNFSEILTPEK